MLGAPKYSRHVEVPGQQDVMGEVSAIIADFTLLVASNIRSYEPGVKRADLKALALEALNNYVPEHTEEDITPDTPETVARIASTVFYECSDLVRRDGTHESELVRDYFRAAHFGMAKYMTSEEKPRSMTWFVIQHANRGNKPRPDGTI